MSAGQHSAARVGRYILEHRVASGGMGEVFSARAVGAAGTSKRVCIKRILASRKLSEGAIAHFISEAKLSMQLSHANVVPVFDFGRAEDGYYLVMEWVDGVDLGVVLDASIAEQQPFTVAEVSYIGARLAHGLAHAHSRKIIHRDVKPSNLLVSRAGQIHLTDFGVAMLSGTDLPAAGTPAYMAPEQRWAFDVDARADVFAMGVTLHHLATGKVSRDPEEVRQRAPEPFRELFARMVAPLVENRPADMEEVARELERMESVAVASGAELPRVSLQRRVAALATAPSTHPSLELPFMTGASLAAVPLTFTTETSLAADPVSDAETPRLDATPAPGADAVPRAVSTDIGSATTLPVGEDAPRGAAASPRRAGRARWWGAGLATLAAAGAVLYVELVPSAPTPDGSLAAVEAPQRAATPDGALPPEAPTVRAAPPPGEPPIAPEESPRSTAPPSVVEPAPTRAQRPLPRAVSRDVSPAPVAAEPAPIAAAATATGEAEATALLHVGARPWAEVFVDGRRVGQTPISGLRLPPGLHQVRLVNGPLDAQRTIDVRLAPGETRYVREDME